MCACLLYVARPLYELMSFASSLLRCGVMGLCICTRGILTKGTEVYTDKCNNPGAEEGRGGQGGCRPHR